MSFATGEDVIRTVESIVSDLTQSLTTNFTHVKKGDEVYLAPKRVQVWQTPATPPRWQVTLPFF